MIEHASMPFDLNISETAVVTRSPADGRHGFCSSNSKLTALLQGPLGSDVISLSGQDHYVEVRTPNGHDLILMRLSDAILQIGWVDGCLVHRSHWVAKAHANELIRENGKLRIVLSDGRKLPVSEARMAEVKETLGL